MSFTILGAPPITAYTKLTGNTATTVLPGVKQTVTILSVECTETNGGTPNLTIDVYDTANTTAYYKKNAQAMTAKQTVLYDEPFTIPNGWVLRVTSSDASGHVDVMVNYIPGDASRRSA